MSVSHRFVDTTGIRTHVSGRYPEDIRGYSLFHLAADIVGLVEALGRFAASPSVTTWAEFSVPSTLGFRWMW